MGKFLKKIESSAITGVYNEIQLSVINHYKDQPKNGPTIYSFENPETKITRSAFVDKSTQFEYDDVTSFEWHFGYKDGYPGVYITFSNLHDYLKKRENECIICLETNSCSNSTNQTISVFMDDEQINYSFKNITWFKLSDIKLGTTYFIYLTLRTCHNMTHWFGRRKTDINQISDWEIRANIRPTIRINDSFKTPYTNYKSLSDYKKVIYLYHSEYQI